MLPIRLLVAAAVSPALLLSQETLYTLRVDVPVVTVDVTVTGPDNRPAPGLSREDFLVYENGVEQPIVYFSPTAEPYHILLLFDRSGSTRGQWLLMQKAVAGFLANLRPQDRAAVAAFDEVYELLSDWDDSFEDALQALEKLVLPRSGGVTEFYRSLERAVTREFRDIPARRAVIVFSDGRETEFYRQILSADRVPGFADDRSFMRRMDALRRARVPIYFIAVNTDLNLREGTEAGADYLGLRQLYVSTSIPLQFLTEVRLRMEALADATGGRVYLPKRLEDIIPLYEAIGRELGTSYSLGYAPAEREPDGQYRQIAVRVRGEGYRVTQSRSGYYAR